MLSLLRLSRAQFNDAMQSNEVLPQNTCLRSKEAAGALIAADVCFMRLQLNDKEVALAHQKRVSLMLALSVEELQKKKHLNSHSAVPPSAPPDTPETDSVSH